MISIALADSKGGVFDYSKILGERLQPKAALQQIHPSFRFERGNGGILLQYSGYGFAKRGAPFWLLDLIRRDRKNIDCLGIFFHELYAFGPPWSSAFWLSPFQRTIAKGLAGLSDFWITNREESSKWLRGSSEHRPFAVLPTFSNVGEPANAPPVRENTLIIFGSAPLRSAAYRTNFEALKRWVRTEGISLHDIGPPIVDPDVRELQRVLDVIELGRLPEQEVSARMLNAEYGLIAYPLGYLAKSGVFAAYAAHRLCPIVLSPPGKNLDGLRPDREFIHGVPALAISHELRIGIQHSVSNWYYPHRIASHVTTVTNLMS